MKKALALVLIFSLFGLMLLMLIAEFSEPAEVPIILLQEHIGSTVKIQGKVISAGYSDSLSSFRVKDKTGEVRVVVFYPE